MTGALISTLQNVLKDDYLPPVVEQINQKVLLLQRLDASDREIVGNQAVVPLHTNRTAAIGSRAENSSLPSAGAQAFTRATYTLKSHYGRIEITGQAIQRTKNNVGAFVQGLQVEMDGVKNDITKDMARQTYGDGSGKVGACATSGASTTITLNSNEPLLKGQIYNGMLVDIGTAGMAASLAAGQAVSAVNATASTFVIPTSIATTSGTHFVFRAGNASGGTVFELNGLQAIINSTANQALGGITPSNDYWDNLRLASGGSLSISLMQQAWNNVMFNGETPTACYCSLGVQRSYYQLLQSQVRYVDSQTLAGGFKALEFMGEPLIADVDAPFGKLFFVVEPHIKVYADGDWRWLDQDGSILHWVVNKDAYEAVLARYMEMGSDRRNVQLVVTGITDTSGT